MVSLRDDGRVGDGRVCEEQRLELGRRHLKTSKGCHHSRTSLALKRTGQSTDGNVCQVLVGYLEGPC